MSNTFDIEVYCVFKAQLKIEAENKNEAENIANNHFGFVRGPVQTINDNIIDWEVPIHPENHIQKLKEISKTQKSNE